MKDNTDIVTCVFCEHTLSRSDSVCSECGAPMLSAECAGAVISLLGMFRRVVLISGFAAMFVGCLGAYLEYKLIAQVGTGAVATMAISRLTACIVIGAMGVLTIVCIGRHTRLHSRPQIVLLGTLGCIAVLLSSVVYFGIVILLY